MANNRKRKRATPSEAAALRKKWNVFEWNRPEQYKYVQKLEGDRLRWEFLRRDTEYRKKYENHHPNTIHPLLGRYISPKKCGSKLPSDFSFLDTARRGKPLLLQPPQVKTLLFTREEMNADKRIREHYAYRLEELYDLGYVVMAFDANRVPAGQIREAKRILNDYHNEISEQFPNQIIGGKRSPKDASKLLRALDAELVGVETKFIAADIFGSEHYEYFPQIGRERLIAAKNYWRVM